MHWRDVRKQYKRNHQLWTAKDEDLPIIGTIASKFNDDGVNHLFEMLLKKIEEKTSTSFGKYQFSCNSKGLHKLLFLQTGFGI